MLPHTHLSLHSYFSLLSGLIEPGEIAKHAADAGHTAIALTDHNRLTGAVDFAQACKEHGVRPIFGMHVEMDDAQSPGDGSAILLAKDAEGWANLCRLSSWLQGEQNNERGTLPMTRLLDHDGGLLCLATSEVAANGMLQSTFGDRLYVQDFGGGAQQATSSIKRVAIWPIYYEHKEQENLHRLATAMRFNVAIDLVPADALAPAGAYFPSNDEFLARFAALPRSLETITEIVARCTFDLPLDKPNFPELELPAGQTPISLLREKAYTGARRHYAELSPPIEERLEHELGVIEETGYATLFLIMEEIVAFAHQADVPIASRGSASSSLVAHCLNITTPDPVRHNLFFERFLNPARPNPPDVDTDVCSRRRDLVIHHVYDTYGHDRVAMVATINRFRRRSALREVAKAHGLNPEQIKTLVDTLPYRYWEPGTRTEKGERPYREIENRFREPRFQAIFRDAEAMLDVPHHLSIHPGGVVISAGPLNDTVPTQFSGKGVTITQYDLEGVQRMGLVKMDLLGIRGLTVLGDVADQIRARHPELGDSRREVLEAIPDDDPATAEVVRNGRTIGCFQIESPGMRATLREVKSDHPDNIMVALALFRPGPLQGGLKDAFVRRHLKQEEVEHLHPALSQLLEETHGVFLYQEQVLRVAHELAGFSLAESDLLRRAMSHFDPGKQMQTLKEKFIRNAGATKQVPPPIAERIWEMMAAFAGYGFPKAHSASYAKTAWRSAWCKTHYPAEFMAAVLANWGGYYDQSTYILEARRMGLRVRAPHVNYSEAQFSVTYLDGLPHLFMGLDQLRDLTRETQMRIAEGRPFTSLGDMLARVSPRKGEARNLVIAGALEGLGSIPALLEELETGGWKRGQMSLFSHNKPPEVGDWTDSQKAAAQEELLGVSLIAHPLEVFAAQIAAAGAVSTLEAASRTGQEARVAGMRQMWRRVQTAEGKQIYFMDLADFEGTLRVVIPEDVYQRDRAAFVAKEPVLVHGWLDAGRESPEPVMRASRLSRLS
jgi:DNA polymerase-3 subunit alpha